MKISQDIRRKLIQTAAFGFSNSYIGNFSGGSLYKGSWKNFCNPGINCYSCPAARMACPIGAMQAVGSSAKFSLGFYALGFVLALGVVFGRAICGFICPAGTLEGGIPMLLTHPELQAQLGGLFGLKAVILVATLIGCIICCRFFCKVMCPLLGFGNTSKDPEPVELPSSSTP